MTLTTGRAQLIPYLAMRRDDPKYVALNDAIKAGRDAYDANQAKGANPHEAGSDLAVGWAAGFDRRAREDWE